MPAKQSYRWLPFAILASVLGAGWLAFRWFDSLFDPFDPSEEIVARIPAPGGRRTAIIVEVNGGATTAYGYSVRIEPGGEEAMMAYAASVKGKSGVEAKWLDEQTLEVSFDHARFTLPGKIKGLRVIAKGKVDPEPK